MLEDLAFHELIRRVQAGESEAVTELVRLYEPEVRLAVRTLLSESALRRQFDSLDIVQSVFARFCSHAAEGKFQLDTPAQLVALLNKMAFNRFLDRARHEQAQQRDHRRVEGRDEALATVVAEQPSPSTIVGWREEFAEIRRRFTDAERELAERWARGESWIEIGGAERSDEDRLRHQFDAAFARVARQLAQLRNEEVTTDYLQAVYRWVVEQTAV